ncbi:MAG: sigma-70 family RNA polymerase sigma factor [Deltaproteobacteria bacterium]|nr:sigma-70 family RNA polymerase sigma factor [Deltaproteobacteria bacterium]
MESLEACPERTELEDELRAYAREGQYERAATLAIERYGAEVLGYMFAVLSAPSDADEAFSEVCERLWRGLPSFEWRCSCRTWMYVIARNVGRNRIRAAARAKARVVPLSEASQVAKIADRVRSSTAIHLKTESRTRLDEVRAALEPDDRTLLVLRIDRKLSWTQIATVLSDDGTTEGPALAREAARLRKRFERLKSKVVQSLKEGRDAPDSDR